MKWTSEVTIGKGYGPEERPGEGLGDHNYCRNPWKADGSTIWCYTDPETGHASGWDYCDPVTEELSGEKDSGYRG